MSSFLLSFVYPPPPSVFVTAMSAISFASLANTGAAEVRGQHLNYSKFWNAVTSTRSNAGSRRLPSREGMLLLYAPALVAALASFAIPGAVVGERARWLSAALSIHFFKRVMEVLFIHQYSGHMLLGSALPISFSYFISTATMIYAQYLTQPMSEPASDLKYIGVALFFLGLAGNFYHHYLLSKLRKQGEKEYKIPRGGLFDLVVCPHYLFEILGFFGVSLISQTVYAFSFTFGTMFYLIGRSYATRKWYLSKFDQFPKHVKALIPYVF
ncbi:3-oxo-5-alpha-steroid 4-dehydrogenase 2 [Ananas comosus]|uniref:3-oxo-5-alpha-steroid 4-dehydrogenase 2 n=1 Tax=Ananas comosus TaxID=4615 RepID=A0A199VW02_ANACO|nr:3-oxo-5-alpha-steroid 4-dehydrogenase 2 [Ananas comosus]OAY81422.1 3-oxo-5-alpha-steroid 4-dehydrogenase 2 [Ananas comosus]